MIAPNPVGFHTTLTDQTLNKIVECTPRSFTIKQISRRSCIPYTNLHRWLKRGEEEVKDGKQSNFVQLWLQVERIRSLDFQDLIDKVVDCRSNWQAAWELLRTVARDDFGTDSQDQKELLELFKGLAEKIHRLENPLQGAIENGEGERKELDSRRDEE